MSWPILNSWKLSLEFACTLSGVKCGNHDTEMIPQLLNVGDIDQVHEKMVEMPQDAYTGGCFRLPIAAEVDTETMRKRSSNF